MYLGSWLVSETKERPPLPTAVPPAVRSAQQLPAELPALFLAPRPCMAAVQICISGIKTEKIREGKILGGVQGYLEGLFGDPSLHKSQENVQTRKKI